MKKNVFNTYFDKRLKSIKQHLISYKQDQKPEDLHHIRVEIKKIKAILSFAKDLYEEAYDLSELKPLFKKAGAIRELQINRQLLVELPPFPKQYLKQLKQEETDLTQQFIRNNTRYLKSAERFREGLSLPENLPAKKHLKAHFKKELKKAHKKWQNKNRKDMHRYRRKLKNMLYLYNALPEKVQHSSELDKTGINQQQQKLGKWHDLYSAISFLSRQAFSTKITDYIARLKTKESKRFKSLLKDHS